METLFCVGLNLQILMLSSRGSWGMSLGHCYLWRALTDISLTEASVMTELPFVALIMNAKPPSATTIRELYKTKVYYL